MLVLPDSVDMLSSSCLLENPWHKFPFTGFVAMLSALVTLVVDSMATSLYSKKNQTGIAPTESMQLGDHELAVVHAAHSPGYGHHHYQLKGETDGSQRLRYRVIAMVI